MTQSGQARGYLLVTACYWMFTLSDGALRMLVLLHLHARGETAWGLALLLLPYEVAGVLTNLFGGYVGTRFGLKPPLVAGLGLQAIACLLLAVDPTRLTVVYVAATQVLSGVAKDLAKTSAKSYVRLLSPERKGAGLFGPVAFLTGSKNTIKGLGFFVGGAMLALLGFQGTNQGFAALLGFVALAAACILPRAAGGKQRKSRLLRPDRATLWLSIARTFLFGSRDAWFAIALPLFLISQGWSEPLVGGFLAAWVIVYGIVQAMAPRIARARDERHGARVTLRYTLLLLLPLLATAGLVGGDVGGDFGRDFATIVLAGGLCLYGALFAVTSSLHSWLIVALHSHERTAERVGFYYAANAMGRVLGVLISGACYALAPPAQGLALCLIAASLGVLVAAACSGRVQAALPTGGMAE